MEQYIPKSVLVAEIERRIKETESMQPKFDQFWAGQISAFKGILKILDTFEVKEVDLEKAIDDYIYTHDGRKRLALELDWKCCNLTLKGGDNIIKFAKHFFELGLLFQTETNITFKYNIGESVREYKAHKGE